MPDDRLFFHIFTDPMMGLSYESEPVFSRLETHFPDIVPVCHMAVLVRDVYDLVDQHDLQAGQEYALERYCRRLADIYRDEEQISGMPVCMDDFHLFDTTHTSSMPLDLACTAVQILVPELAQEFLYNLRYATIVECRQTTKEEEILRVVRRTGIGENRFLRCFRSRQVEEALQNDIQLCRSHGIFSLPAYMLCFQDRVLQMRGVRSFEEFSYAIDQVSGGSVTQKKVEPDLEHLTSLIEKHPVISPLEIQAAFDLENEDAVFLFIRPLLTSSEIFVHHVCHGTFLIRKDYMERM